MAKRRNLPTSQAILLLALVILTALHAMGQAAAYHTIYSFAGGADGASPHAGVTLGKDGELFGTTYTGGGGDGTIFELTPVAGGSWEEKVLHRFTGDPDGPDGAFPVANLVFNEEGVLYGTTLYGGTGGGGTVFELTPPATVGEGWANAILYNVPGGRGQRNPYGAVFFGAGGALYTTTFADAVQVGGYPYGGTVFELTPPVAPGGSWTEHTLFKFTDTAAGDWPFAGMV